MQPTVGSVCPGIIIFCNLPLSQRTSVTSSGKSATPTSNSRQYVRTIRTTDQVEEDFEKRFVLSKATPPKKQKCSRQLRETLSICSAQLSRARKSEHRGPVRSLLQLKAGRAVTDTDVRSVGDNRTTCKQAWKADHRGKRTVGTTITDSF